MSEHPTLPPSADDGEAAVMTPAAFRRLLQELVGTPLAALHEDVRCVRNDISALERRVSALENVRNHYPMALSMVSLLVAVAALLSR